MIRIINDSTFGYFNGVYVEPKRKGDPPFSVNEERETELVASGIAEYVSDAPVEISKEYLESLKIEPLKKIAEEYGISYRFGMKKTALINEILKAHETDDCEDDFKDAETDDEDAAEDIPVFDAADAVV